MSDELQYALERMLTPLHESRLSGVTAQEDARCMDVIRDAIIARDARIAELERELEVAIAQRDHERACREYSAKLLIGIHSLMYPAPIAMPDGRIMVFRPKSLDPHEVLQELSDRIRALPDELAKATKL